jgi:hypothetical protein
VKSLRTHLVTATLLAAVGIGAIAQAQTPPPANAPGAPRAAQGDRRPDPQRMEQFRARMEERMARRMGALKQKLQVGAAQEGAWTAWTSAMKPTQFQRPNRGEFAQLSTPERIDRMRALRSQRNAEMDRRMDATKTFYAALNAEQKKVFDTEGMRFMRGGRDGKRDGHRGHHGHHRG